MAVPFAKQIAAFNRRVTNPILDPIVWFLPGYGRVETIGRQTGRRHVAPMMGFPSDDGRFAVVEAAFRTSTAAKNALRNVPFLAAFDRHSSKRADVERDIRRFRKDFSLDGPATPGRQQ